MKKHKKPGSRGGPSTDREFRLFFQHCADGALVTNRNGVILAVNPALCQMSGYAESELIGRPAFDLVPAVDLKAKPPRWGELRAGKTIVSERRMRREDGSLLVIEASARATPGGRFVAILRDITDRRRLEAAWTEATDRLRQQYEQFPLPTYTWKKMGDDFVLVDFNQAGGAITGGRVREALGKRATEFYADMPDVAIDISRCLAEGVTFRRETRYRFRTTGEVRDLVVHYVPIAPDSVVVHTEDITERTKEREALADWGRQMAGILGGVGDIVYQVANDDGPMTGRVAFVSDSVEPLLGYQPHEFVRDLGLWARIVHPDDVTTVRDETLGMFASKRACTRVYRVRHKGTGEYRWMEDRTVPQLNPNGDVVGYLGTARDVTGRKQAEERLRLLESVVVSTNDAVIVTDTQIDSPGPVIVYVNDAFTRMTGYAPDEAVGQSPRFLQGPTTDRDTLVRLRQALEARQSTRAELINYRKDGSEFWVDLAVVPLHDAGGAVTRWVSIQRDITERKRAEQLMRESRERLRRLAVRLQAVREEERTYLAREVHDELGQTLTGLKMDLAWLLGKPVADEAVLYDRLRAMVAVVDATIGQVRRLSTRLRPAVLDDLGLVAAVEWQVQETSSKSGLECSLDLPVEEVKVAPNVKTSVFRILQEALTNVVRHAGARHVEVDLSVEGDQLILEVRDDGKGVRDEGVGDPESLGFIGMRERTKALGGKLDIAQRVEGGTVVRLSLSLGKSNRAP